MDDWAVIALYYERLTEVKERPDLATAARYQDARGRAQHADELCAEIQRWTEQHTYDEVFSLLAAANVPAGGVYSVREIMTDPHYAAREEIAEVTHPAAGTVKMPRVIPKLSRTPGEIRFPGATLGEHNAAVYGGLLGLSEAEQGEQLATGVI